MKDQREHWNNAHKEQWLHAHSQHQTEFAEEVQKHLPTHAKILELGCGEGNDSVYFAALGHEVTATDFSDVAISQNKERYSNKNLHFEEQDMSQSFSFSDESFDAVYARLSLHYFTDNVTQVLFREISRVLKPNGTLYFMCKAVGDPIYGKGQQIEPDMFELDGHVRHFFSEEYVAQLLNHAGLTSESVITGEEVIYDRQSAFIKVLARKD
jgi:ubiquinone/menaquinone biosynthesis C-methylase UbiE